MTDNTVRLRFKEDVCDTPESRVWLGVCSNLLNKIINTPEYKKYEEDIRYYGYGEIDLEYLIDKVMK